MVENKISKIEKPWAVYEKGYIRALGEIIEDHLDWASVRISEDSPFSYLWYSDCITKFKTLHEATLFYSTGRKEKLEEMINYFPKALKQESVQNLYNILVSYKNKLSSQSLPKCTEENLMLEQSNIC